MRMRCVRAYDFLVATDDLIEGSRRHETEPVLEIVQSKVEPRCN